MVRMYILLAERSLGAQDLARMFASMYCGASDPEAISPTSLKLEGLPPMVSALLLPQNTLRAQLNELAVSADGVWQL